MTDQQGPAWLKNLYFVYLLELKALTKVGPQLKNYPFYTGDDLDDKVSLL
jgi:ERO1-like protein alpha